MDNAPRPVEGCAMPRLKSRTQCAVDGFQFIDAPISADVMKEWDFNVLVNRIYNQRVKNPRFNLSTDMNAIADEVDLANALRMTTIPNAESYIIADPGGGMAVFRVPPSTHNWASAAGEKSKALLSGAAVLTEWLGAGGVPVAPELAESRAAVCVVCPLNQGGDWLSWFTAPVAAFIRAQLNKREEMKLTTSHDAKLEICSACKCPLKLKVHVPLPYIANRIGADIRAKLDPNCWITKELKT